MVFILRVLGDLAHRMYFGFLFGDEDDHFTAFLYAPDLGKAINQAYFSQTFCFLHLILKFCASCVNQKLSKWFSNKDPLEPYSLFLSSSFLSISFLLPIINLPLSIYRKKSEIKSPKFEFHGEDWASISSACLVGKTETFSSKRSW